MGRILISSLVAGAVLFIWSSLSWMVLPWHNNTFKGFSNEEIVSSALLAGSEKPGVYLLPKPMPQTKGPFALVVWNREGSGDMGHKMLMAFVEDVLAALLAAWLLALAGMRSFVKRLLFVAGLGLFAGLATRVPDYIWWGFSSEFTIVGVADLVIAWSLAGLVLAKMNDGR